MAKKDGIPRSMQESLLALLMFHAGAGAKVASQIEVQHFDSPYQPIAEKVIGYWNKYGRPPDKAHLDDILGWALEKGDRSAQLRRLVLNVIELNEGINPDFVVSCVQDHIHLQNMKAALLNAGERVQQGGEGTLDDIQQIMHDALQFNPQAMDEGTFLGDTSKSLRFLERKQDDYIPMGIKELDWIGFGAHVGQLLLNVAPKSSGKSWGCVHMGVQGIKHGVNVLHVSLEMSEDLVTERYFQRLFGGGVDDEEFVKSRLQFDDLNRLTGYKATRQRPKRIFKTVEGRKWLRSKIKSWGVRLNRLVVKDFPSGSLTINQLERYLDELASIEKFIPKLLIVDYPLLMRIDPRNFRIEAGALFVGLRGLAKQRGMALYAPHQSGRQTIRARRVRSKDTAETIVAVNTADNVLTFQRTAHEEQLGLARLSVEHARRSKSGDEIVITQAYAIGQYVMQSARMNKKFGDILDQEAKREFGDEEEGDEEGFAN